MSHSAKKDIAARVSNKINWEYYWGYRDLRCIFLSYKTRLISIHSIPYSSHHPLRETLMQQTGETVKSRESFLRSFYQDALKVILQRWQPEEKFDEFF